MEPESGPVAKFGMVLKPELSIAVHGFRSNWSLLPVLEERFPATLTGNHKLYDCTKSHMSFDMCKAISRKGRDDLLQVFKSSEQ